MKNMIRNIKISVLILTAMVMAILAGCASKETTASEKKRKNKEKSHNKHWNSAKSRTFINREGKRVGLRKSSKKGRG
ncbi:hypothetical protein GCM10020331_076250 [Ectobacillus funiculus]